MLSSEHIENKSQLARLVFVALIVWLALVFVLGARGTFIRAPGALPVAGPSV